LLYISNFKGGNAAIHETEQEINSKLVKYSVQLQDIFYAFGTKNLSELTDDDVELLISKVETICDLTNKGTNSQIDGFSVSYLSALLNSYYPNLIPILDRRVLINLELVTENDIVESSGQIKNIRAFYGSLIRKMAELCKEGQNIRDLDEEIFKKKFPKTA